MTSVQKALPKNGASRFRDGCTAHWQVVPGSSERGLVTKQMFCSKADANARAAEIKSQVHRGVFVRRDDKTTVAEWAEVWMRTINNSGIRKSTSFTYGQMVRLRIVPALGTMPMTAVRKTDVSEWVGTMLGRYSSLHNIGKAVWVLKSMYRLWEEDGRPLPLGIPVPPMKKLLPTEEPSQRVSLTRDQVHAWRDALPYRFRVMFAVEAFTGCRYSEMLGLQEQDVRWTGRDVSADFTDELANLVALPPDQYAKREPRLRIQAQLGWDDTGNPMRAPTKNRRANRDLPLPQWLAEPLAETLGCYPPVDGWLFVNYQGEKGNGFARHPKPYSQRLYRKWVAKARDEAGITLPPNMLTHALRHFRVSELRDGRRYSNEQIGLWIGDHPGTVEQVYGAPMPDTLDRIEATITELEVAPRLRVVGD